MIEKFFLHDLIVLHRVQCGFFDRKCVCRPSGRLGGDVVFEADDEFVAIRPGADDFALWTSWFLYHHSFFPFTAAIPSIRCGIVGLPPPASTLTILGL